MNEEDHRSLPEAQSVAAATHATQTSRADSQARRKRRAVSSATPSSTLSTMGGRYIAASSLNNRPPAMFVYTGVQESPNGVLGEESTSNSDVASSSNRTTRPIAALVPRCTIAWELWMKV